MNSYVKLMGFEAKDRITGFSGVVSAIGFDLYGCVQALVTPRAGKDGKVGDSGWYDAKRIEATSRKPVMEVTSVDLGALDLLGKEACDRVTGLAGVITSVCFDISERTKVILNPKVGKDGSPLDTRWCDVARLQVTGKKPVMPVPTFEIAGAERGPAAKPPMITPPRM